MKYIHVVAAIIGNSDGRILISKRPKHKPQGELWEFPGGKIENGELPLHALVRELREELGIEVTSATQILEFPYEYPDMQINFHIWKVSQYQGEAYGKENQVIQWIHSKALLDYQFPAANQKIIDVLTESCKSI